VSETQAILNVAKILREKAHLRDPAMTDHYVYRYRITLRCTKATSSWCRQSGTTCREKRCTSGCALIPISHNVMATLTLKTKSLLVSLPSWRDSTRAINKPIIESKHKTQDINIKIISVKQF
jgi:hypothetical protein